MTNFPLSFFSNYDLREKVWAKAVINAYDAYDRP